MYCANDLHVGNDVYYEGNMRCNNNNAIIGYHANSNFIVEND